MRENMPDTHGWREHTQPRREYHEFDAGPVNGILGSSYTRAEVAAIHQQGRDRPRALTHDETERVKKNRQIAREDLAAMENWYNSQIRLPKHKAGPEDMTLDRIEVSDEDIWKPFAW
jgi:hypothetical protein